MNSPPQTPKPLISMAKPPSFISDTLLFFGGAAAAALLFFLSFSSFFLSPSPSSTSTSFSIPLTHPHPLHVDPTLPSFYDDTSLSYTLSQPLIRDWDRKRRRWLWAHPSFGSGLTNRTLMVSGSQPGPCPNPIGDNLLLRFFKNKVDYCRLHGIDIFYNNALLEPKMFSFWAKIPVVRAAMVAHPEAEWIWWVDSDAAFTDMEFELPFEKYQSYNLVLHGWPHLVFEEKSWTSLNAGVFLMRNCQWSIDFIDRWARMGPQSPEYNWYGEIQRKIFKDKLYRESDDQTGIAYLLLEETKRWRDKIYLENEFYFEGYWVEIVNQLERTEEKYLEIERRAKALRRRRAEKVGVDYGRMRGEILKKEGIRTGRDGLKRPFVTHFTGCQPCSGDHNKIYSGENCFEGMKKALNFADNQVLRAYGFRHERLVNSSGVLPLQFDFPAN